MKKEHKIGSSRFKGFLWWLYQSTWPFYYVKILYQLFKRNGISQGWVLFNQLPPGDLIPSDHHLATEQDYLLSKTKRYGAIFKSQTRECLVINVVDLSLGRKLLTENEKVLGLRAKQLTGMFPIGHLRGMHGETHRYYRRAFIQAMRPELFSSCESDLRQSIQYELAEHYLKYNGNAIDTSTIIELLRSITTSIMLRLMFGVFRDEADFNRLRTCYNDFSWSSAPAYEYRDHESQVFREIREIVMERARKIQADDNSPTRSVLQHLAKENTLDDTHIGNLIYMVESGRFDTYSLLRWVVKYLSEQGPLQESLLGSNEEPVAGSVSLSMAVVLETLRCNQSEAIQRDLSDDITFENYLFPAGSRVRICLWEAHKNESYFPGSLSFRPERFLDKQPGMDQFAPFGVDQHRCVAADIVVRLATLFVEEFSRNYLCQAVSDGLPVRGPFHWEPNTNYSMRIVKR